MNIYTQARKDFNNFCDIVINSGWKTYEKILNFFKNHPYKNEPNKGSWDTPHNVDEEMFDINYMSLCLTIRKGKVANPYPYIGEIDFHITDTVEIWDGDLLQESLYYVKYFDCDEDADGKFYVTELCGNCGSEQKIEWDMSKPNLKNNTCPNCGDILYLCNICPDLCNGSSDCGECENQ